MVRPTSRCAIGARASCRRCGTRSRATAWASTRTVASPDRLARASRCRGQSKTLGSFLTPANQNVVRAEVLDASRAKGKLFERRRLFSALLSAVLLQPVRRAAVRLSLASRLVAHDGLALYLRVGPEIRALPGAERRATRGTSRHENWIGSETVAPAGVRSVPGLRQDRARPRRDAAGRARGPRATWDAVRRAAS